MIQEHGEKLCKVTDDLNTLLHVAAKNGLTVYVYWKCNYLPALHEYTLSYFIA